VYFFQKLVILNNVYILQSNVTSDFGRPTYITQKRLLLASHMEDKPKSKNYMDILEDLFTEKEITKQEYGELKEKYEYSLQRHSHSAY
jgi:hypothetical protein